MGRTRKRGERRRGRLLVLVLLGLVGGYGTWNYQRAVAAEAQEVRPYRAYSDADLVALEAAYRAEVEALDAEYQAVSGRQRTVRDQGFGQGQVDEFERIQRASRAVRELGFRASEQQATLQEIVKERERRASRAPEWQRILELAFLYRG